MNAVTKNIYLGMVKGELEQAWALLDADQYDMARHHLQAADAKVCELQDMEATEKLAVKTEEKKQITLEI